MANHSRSAAGIVLVVESDREAARSVARVLRERGYDVVVAGNGVDAIAELHDAEFDVVIVDIDIAPRGGHDVLRIAKELSPDIEIIFGSSASSATSRAACHDHEELKSGPKFETLLKPFDVDELTRAVARAVEHRRLHTTTALYRACRDVGGSTTPERLPSVLVDLSMVSLEADGVMLLLPSPDGGLHIGHHAAYSTPNDASAASRIELARLLVLDGGRRAAAIMPEDATSDALKAAVEEARLRSAIVYPLTSGSRLAGVLLAWRSADPRPFRRTDLDRAAVLAAPILLALENVRLLGRMLASERLAAIGELAAGVAHEINNPLTYIVGNHSYALEQLTLFREVLTPILLTSSALQQQVDAIGDEIREALTDADSGAQRIVEISHDLRTMSRYSPDNTEIVDVSDAARAALRITAARIRQSANVIVDLHDGARAHGSQGRLCQVFVNLIVNAAQAADGGGAANRTRPIDLFVTTARQGNRIVATVRDTGPGIRREDLPRLFDTFFTTKLTGLGTGLGLAVTRQIVEEMGGTIDVRSEVGVGTTFTATFPAVESATNSGVPAIGAEAASGGRMRLLFVDDEFPVLRCYERWFGREHDVETVQSSDRAMEFLREQPNLTAIVCDIVMPRATGPEVYARVKAEFPELASRFIFVTGALGETDVRAQVAKLPCPVLEKPIDIKVLRETLRSMHERVHLRVA